MGLNTIRITFTAAVLICIGCDNTHQKGAEDQMSPPSLSSPHPAFESDIGFKPGTVKPKVLPPTEIERPITNLHDDQREADDSNDLAIDASGLTDSWKKLGFRVEVPWRRSNFPDKNYSYIAQARRHIGAVGQAGYATEIECEILGHTSENPHTVSAGVEVWNEEFKSFGQNLALNAMRKIGPNLPDEIVTAFKAGENTKLGQWEVRKDTNVKLEEIRIYYRLKPPPDQEIIEEFERSFY